MNIERKLSSWAVRYSRLQPHSPVSKPLSATQREERLRNVCCFSVGGQGREWSQLLKRQSSHDFMHFILGSNLPVLLAISGSYVNPLSKVGPIMAITANTSVVRY